MSPTLKLTILFFDRVLRAFLGLASFIFITNYLEPTQVGIYSLVMAIIAISAGFIGLGITSVVVVDAAKDYQENAKIIQQDFFIRLLSSIFILIISLIFVNVFYRESEVWLNYLIISIFLVTQISVTFENDLKAKGEPHKIAIIKSVSS